MSTIKQPKALVTGASRGIGFQIASTLLESSFKVIGTAKSSAFNDALNKKENFDGKHLELGYMDELYEMIFPLFDREDPPDIVVNNAGISEEAPFSNSDEEWIEIFDKTTQINLKSPALICKWALNSWVDTSIPGIIINISSRAGYRGDTGEFAAYAASKGGLAAFTKSIARSFGEHDITAFTIAPGFVDTDMAHDVKKVYGESYLTDDLSLSELTPPEQVANIVQFLAEGKCKHMTGSTFHVNAGSYMV